MKAILEFNLPEEQNDFDAALHGMDYLGILQDFNNLLRGKIKHGDEHHLQPVRDALLEMVRERDLTL